MVLTIHRYVFRELMKVFVLASIALTLILSLGSVIGPIQEYGVGPSQIVHLMCYFIPITLTFVLPMAALFSASLVYGRLASDNELDACRASGISILTMAYPGAILAIIVAIANLLLSFYVMPDFIHRAENSLKANAKQIVFRNLKRKGYYKMPPAGEYLLYADYVNPQDSLLAGVIAINIADGQKIQKIITADKAKVSFITHDRYNQVQITLYDLYQLDMEKNSSIRMKKFPVTTDFGSMLRDRVKFKKIGEMKKIARNPIRFYPIEKLARNIASRFTCELLSQDISKHISTKNDYLLAGEPNSIVFTCDSCQLGDSQLDLSGSIRVIEFDSSTGTTLKTFQCAKATIHLEGDELAPTLTMSLYNATWQKPADSDISDDSELTGLGQRTILSGLFLPQPIAETFSQDNLLSSITPAKTGAALHNKQTSNLSAQQRLLSLSLKKVLSDITAEIHSRLVFGLGCIFLILIGIATGILLKGGHLLSSFGVSSIPAALLIVSMMAGKNIMKNSSTAGGSAGLIIMWSGLFALIIITFMVYKKLLKH